MTSLRWIVIFCTAAAFAGCAGTRGSSPLPSGNQVLLPPASTAQLSVQQPAGTSGTLTFQIAIPTEGAAHSYVSPSTKGLVFDFFGPPYGQRVYNVTSSDTRCVKTTKLVCTIHVSLTAGTYGG